MSNDPTPPQSPVEAIIVGVSIAALSALTTALATWAVDELRERYGRAKAPPTEKSNG